MIQKNLKDLVYAPATPLRNAISDLYRKNVSICLVCSADKKLIGILTRSDIKQAVLKGLDHQAPISSIMNKEFVSAGAGASEAALRKLARMQSKYGTGTLDRIPLLDTKGHLAGLYVSSDAGQREIPTVLLTGGAGYVGSHVARKLLARGYRTVVLDKLMFGKESVKDLLKNKNFSLVQGDIGDIGTLIKAIAGADYVIHLAGIVGDPASSLDPLQTMEQNHFATKTLIDISKYYGVSRFIFSSSCSVYGSGDQMLDEESKLQPVSLYAQSKLYSERELLREKGENFHPVILRFGTLYGLSPRMRFDLVANTMSAHANASGKITVDGGAQWRPLLHVEDAAAACVAVLEAPLARVSGEIFNVGDTKENYTIEGIAKMVQKYLPKTEIVQLDTVRDRRDYRVSFAKINTVVKWRAVRKLPEGIQEVIKALKSKKFKQWKDKRYNNYLMLKSVFEEMSS
jgi:nucleoside-diphosphate-sugar epimerase/CBS domain-containing protein